MNPPSDTPRFPVMLDPSQRRRFPQCPRVVPREMLRQAEEAVYRNHHQTLDELAARGGLDPIEIICALDGVRLNTFARDCPDPDGALGWAIEEMRRRAARFLTAPEHLPAAVGRRCIAWRCVLCETEAVESGAPPPARVQCKFCKTVHMFVTPEDEATRVRASGSHAHPDTDPSTAPPVRLPAD